MNNLPEGLPKISFSVDVYKSSVLKAFKETLPPAAAFFFISHALACVGVIIMVFFFIMQPFVAGEILRFLFCAGYPAFFFLFAAACIKLAKNNVDGGFLPVLSAASSSFKQGFYFIPVFFVAAIINFRLDETSFAIYFNVPFISAVFVNIAMFSTFVFSSVLLHGDGVAEAVNYDSFLNKKASAQMKEINRKILFFLLLSLCAVFVLKIIFSGAFGIVFTLNSGGMKFVFTLFCSIIFLGALIAVTLFAACAKVVLFLSIDTGETVEMHKEIFNMKIEVSSPRGQKGSTQKEFFNLDKNDVFNNPVDTLKKEGDMDFLDIETRTLEAPTIVKAQDDPSKLALSKDEVSIKKDN